MNITTKYCIFFVCCCAVIVILTTDLKGTEPLKEDVLVHGKQLFELSCAPCHGKNGDGNGPVSANLRIKPWNLITGIYHNRSTFAGKYPTDYDLYLTLTRGLHYTSMPSFRQMDMNDRWAIVQFIKTLSPKFSDTNWFSPPDTMSYPGYIPPSSASLLEGRKIYVKHCSKCHEPQKNGGVMATMIDVEGDPRPAIDLTDPTVYEYSESPIDIFRIATTSLAAGLFSEADAWNVSNYVWSLRSADQFPNVEEK